MVAAVAVTVAVSRSQEDEQDRMHLAHPRTARDDRRSRPENITQISNPPQPLVAYYVADRYVRWPLPGALTASGQHGHRKREKEEAA
jgi:hypothetical protein